MFKALHNAIDTLEGMKFELLEDLSVILISLSSFIPFFICSNYIIFILSAVLYIFSRFKIRKEINVNKNKDSKIINYEREIEGLRIYYNQTIEHFLKILFQDKLGYSNNERISLFIHKDDYFIKLGRYSTNPTLLSYGRSFYPDNQGCISKAWTNAEHIEENLPSYESNTKDYNKEMCSKYNFKSKEVTNLTMKSSSFFAKAIDNFEGDRSAVIVLESITQNKNMKADFVNSIKDDEIKMIQLWIKQSSDSGPDPKLATKEGI